MQSARGSLLLWMLATDVLGPPPAWPILWDVPNAQRVIWSAHTQVSRHHGVSPGHVPGSWRTGLCAGQASMAQPGSRAGNFWRCKCFHCNEDREPLVGFVILSSHIVKRIRSSSPEVGLLPSAPTRPCKRNVTVNFYCHTLAQLGV